MDLAVLEAWPLLLGCKKVLWHLPQAALESQSQQYSVKCLITVSTLKIWHFQRWGMQVRCTTQTFAHCSFANQAVRAQKQAEKTSEARGSLDASLWNHSVGNRLCASFSFFMMFSFQVWVHWLPLPLLKIFSFEHCVLASQGSRAMGATEKKLQHPESWPLAPFPKGSPHIQISAAQVTAGSSGFASSQFLWVLEALLGHHLLLWEREITRKHM